MFAVSRDFITHIASTCDATAAAAVAKTTLTKTTNSNSNNNYNSKNTKTKRNQVNSTTATTTATTTSPSSTTRLSASSSSSLLQPPPPQSPGIYLMKDKTGQVIYVGKAKNLKNRIRSYFAKNVDYKTGKLVQCIADIEYVLTDNEGEAFILESNMIKKYRPRFNIELKDQQRYTYLRLSDEKFPRLLVARRTRDGKFLGKGKTFGPFTSGSSKLLTIGSLRKSFKIRICKTLPKKVCLEYHLGNCDGPCEIKSAQQSYAEHIQDLEDVLNNNQNQMKVFTKKLLNDMQTASESQQFERAIEIRDTLKRLSSLQSSQKMDYVENSDEEYFGISTKDQHAVVMTFRKIHGVIRDSDKFMFDAIADNTFGNFLYQYYTTRKIPRQIIVNQMPERYQLLVKMLSEKSQSNVKIFVPKRGKHKDMLNLILKNIELIHATSATTTTTTPSPTTDQGTSTISNPLKSSLVSQKASVVVPPRKTLNMHWLAEIQNYLSMPQIPYVIECFDISNHGSSFAVGSMSRFVDGLPDKSGYRKFKIKNVRGQDDFAMINEIVTRRYKRLLYEQKDLPNLVLIDGGKGQLHSALNALDSLGIGHIIPCASLAKENEEVFIAGKKTSIIIPKQKKSLQILQHARDEAHRFGVAYNRKIRQMNLLNKKNKKI